MLQVEQPANTCNAICEINSWHRVLHIIAQHKLILEISKTQGDSHGSAPVLFANLVQILQPRRAGNEFALSCFVIFFIKFHFCCELAHVSVWVAFSKRRKSFFLCCSGRFFKLVVFTTTLQNPFIAPAGISPRRRHPEGAQLAQIIKETTYS